MAGALWGACGSDDVPWAFATSLSRSTSTMSERSKGDFDYVTAYLAAAVAFTSKVAAENRGIVYYIG
jgi:hypothetical protein